MRGEFKTVKKSKLKYPLLSLDWGEEIQLSPPPRPVGVSATPPPPQAQYNTTTTHRPMVERVPLGEELRTRSIAPNILHHLTGDQHTPPPTTQLEAELTIPTKLSHRQQPPPPPKPPTKNTKDGHQPEQPTNTRKPDPPPATPPTIHPTYNTNHSPLTTPRVTTTHYMDGHPLQDEVKNNQPPPPPTLPTIPPTNLRTLEEQLPHPQPNPKPLPTSLDGHPIPTRNKDDIVKEDDLLGRGVQKNKKLDS